MRFFCMCMRPAVFDVSHGSYIKMNRKGEGMMAGIGNEGGDSTCVTRKAGWGEDAL